MCKWHVFVGRAKVVECAGAGIESYDVIQALPAYDEAVLGIVGPVADFVSNRVIDCCGDCLIVSIFQSKWAGVVRGPVDAGKGVIVLDALGKKDSELVIKTFRGRSSLPPIMASMARKRT